MSKELKRHAAYIYTVDHADQQAEVGHREDLSGMWYFAPDVDALLAEKDKEIAALKDPSELNVYHHELRPNEYAEFYLKYEADKVIAQLKADYKEALDRLQTANLIKDEQLAATRHQKRKRCLAMAKICECRTAYTCGRILRHNLIWRERWLKLADKYGDVK